MILQSPKQLPNFNVDKISLRRFSSYTLIESNQLVSLNNGNIKAGQWYEYIARLNDNRTCTVLISHPPQVFTPEELSGFNNTGNICIWPSEETLAYYSLANPDLFNGRTVLELGGGMSCLAGLMIAIHLKPTCVHLTDGNSKAVENVYRSIQQVKDASCPLTCSVLKWDRNENVKNIVMFDVIICADCLFFDEYRIDLIDCIWNRLAGNGVALVMAPNRGNTLQEFLIEAKLKGFVVKKQYYYDKRVWDRHVQLLENPDYDEDIHYPILLKLTKLPNNYYQNE